MKSSQKSASEIQSMFLLWPIISEVQLVKTEESPKELYIHITYKWYVRLVRHMGQQLNFRIQEWVNGMDTGDYTVVVMKDCDEAEERQPVLPPSSFF